MTGPAGFDLLARKREIRAQVRRERRDMPQPEDWSRRIWERLFALPEYGPARTVLAYVDAPGEVRTQPYLPRVLRHGKRLVVPYCDGDELGLFFLESPGELSPGALGILEPKPALRDLASKRADVSQLDLFLVPGVAFDRRGARLGHGKGYFDRLLARARADALLVGMAFECQLFPDLPVLPHDVTMDKVLTETAIYAGLGRRNERWGRAW